MKYILVAITLILILAGCSSNTQNVALFNKKQDCAKYIPQIKEEFKNWKSEFTENHQLQEVFYSPKFDTCFKAYTLIGGLTERVTVYAIDDILSDKNVWQKSTGEISDLDAFNAKIKELKE